MNVTYPPMGDTSAAGGALYQNPEYAEDAAVFSSDSAADGGGGGGSAGTKMQAAGDGGWRDAWFLVVFVAHIIGLIIVAGYFGPKMLSFLNESSAQQSQAGNTNASNSGGQYRSLIGLLVVAAVVGSAVAGVWLRVMQRLQGRVVKASLVANFGIVLLSLIVSFAVGSYGTAIIYLVYFVILAVWYYYVRDRIPMAEATLSASSQSLNENSGPIVVAFVLAFLQIGWFAFWAFAFVSVYWATTTYTVETDPYTGNSYTVSNSSGSQTFAVVFCIFSLYWTCQVLKNIGHVTTAGMVASWWLVADIDRPTLGAFKRACTTSLGSICFGSLIVAIVQTVVYLLRQTRGVLAACAACLLSVLDRVIRWFNKFAFVEIAMYGYTFLDSARAVQSLMQAKFWEILINDNLTTAVYLMGNMMAGVVAGLVCGVWAVASGLDGADGIAVLAFCIGFLLSSMFMTVLDSAVCTTYVCWAEDPAAMQRNRPELFNTMALAAQGKYAAEYQQAMAGRMQMQQV